MENEMTKVHTGQEWANFSYHLTKDVYIFERKSYIKKKLLVPVNAKPGLFGKPRPLLTNTS